MGVLREIRRAVLGPAIAEIGCSGFLTEAGLDRAAAALQAAALRAEAPSGPGRLVDIGCGDGGLGRHLARRLGCGALLGLDRDERHIASARAAAASDPLPTCFVASAFCDDPPGPGACDAGLALDSLYLADDLDRALAATRRHLAPTSPLWLTAYVGDVAEGGVEGRTEETWRAALGGAGFATLAVHDASSEWRDLAGRLHGMRLAAASWVLAELVPAAGPYALAISRRMLGLDGRPAFLQSVRRIEISARAVAAPVEFP